MKSQKGFILITSVLFLFLITMLLAYLFQDSLLQEKITGNYISKQRAFLAVESGLRDGERAIQSGGSPFDPYDGSKFTSSCSSGYCSALASDYSTLSNKIQANGIVATAYTDADLITYKISTKPKYLIEVISPPTYTGAEGCSIAIYRVIATGWGSNNSQIIAQSHFASRANECR
jgi:type IV pilus assembly protein PilX